MADIRDEHGNPIQLTDEHGNPVQLTDEFGKPMHLTGVATTTTVGFGQYVGPTTHAATPTAGYAGSTTTGTTTHHATPTDYAKRGAGAVAGAGGATLGAVTGIGVAAKDAVTGHTPGAGTHAGAEAEHRQTTQQQEKKLERSGSSGSSSSEDDQGGRRKKKGLTQKIKEKLTGGEKHREEEGQGQGQNAHGFTTKNSSTVAAAPRKPHDPETIHVEHHEHEKKGMMEKIKEKLPGHHH